MEFEVAEAMGEFIVRGHSQRAEKCASFEGLSSLQFMGRI